MKTVQQAKDALGMAGLSYLVSRRKEYLTVLVGDLRATYVPVDDAWMGPDGQRGRGLEQLIAGLKPLRDAA